MNSFLFSSDIKGFTYLKSTYQELLKRNHQTFILYSKTNHVVSNPKQHICDFNYDSNFDVDLTQGTYIETLGIFIDFIPDYLLVTRDKWPPEQYLIYEFKIKFPNCKIAFIELNTPLYQAIELKMEYLSRIKPPQNQIDIIFDHSEHCSQNRKIALQWEGWDKLVTVGNPSWDNTFDKIDLEKCYKKYNVDKNKTQLIFFSTINSSRNQVLKCLEYISKELDRNKYQLYFKPFPGEDLHPVFSKDYHPFIIPGLDGIIFDQEDLLPMSYICDYHIGLISSVNYGGIFYKKQIIDLNKVCDGMDNFINLDLFLSDELKEIESYTSAFWMKIHNLKNKQEFIELIGLDNIKTWGSKNQEWEEIISKHCHNFNFTMDFLKSPKKDSYKLIKYFDEFFDQKACNRIVTYMENYLD